MHLNVFCAIHFFTWITDITCALFSISLWVSKSNRVWTYLLTVISQGRTSRWPEYSPPENSPWKVPLRLFPPLKSMHGNNVVWLCAKYAFREPVPARVFNPNASKLNYKPEQRRGGTFLGGIYRGGTFRGGVYLEPLTTSKYISEQSRRKNFHIQSRLLFVSFPRRMF